MASNVPTIQRNASRVNESTREAQPHYDISLFSGEGTAATENGGWLDVGVGANLVLALTAANVTGTSPTIDVTIQTSPKSDGTSVRTLGTFTQLTAAGSERKSFACADRYVRARVVLGGTSPVGDVAVAGESMRPGS